MKTIHLKIQKPAYGGYGLGFYNDKAYFVPYAVPGDNVEIEIYKDKKDYCFGRIIKFNDKSEHRIEPLCPNFGKCGGCDYLNVSYDTELQYKKEILAESLRRIARLNTDKIPISIIRDERFNYRSHASVKADAEGYCGFYARESNILTPFPQKGCLLLSEHLVQKLSGLRIAPESEFKIACSNNGDCILSTGKHNIVRESEAGILYDREIRSFFQANRFLRSKMLETVRDYIDMSSGETFLDIGCGVGFFTLYLAAYCNTGYGIDIDKKSIRWAKQNASLNKIDNALFEIKSASGLHSLKNKFNTVIADPPRAGLHEKARTALKEMTHKRFVYVSCNPATFARDAADIIKYGHMLRKTTLIDMFPGTHHIEIIALFE